MTTLPERLQDVIVEFRRIAKDHEIRADRPHQDDATCQWHMGTSEAYDDAADRLEAVQALQAAPEGGEWRTIDSAPKDGTQILVARAGEEIGMGAVEIVDWCVMENWHWEQVGDDLYRKVQDAPSEFWNGNGHRATHWMPLPAAPSPTAALQAGET